MKWAPHTDCDAAAPQTCAFKETSSSHAVLRGDGGNYHRVRAAHQAAEHVGQCDQSGPRPHPCHEAACWPERRTIRSPTATREAPSMWTMVIQKLREAVWRHVCRAREDASLRLASPHAGERRPGMCPRGGPSGVDHRRSLRVAPSGVTRRTQARRW